MHNYKKYNFIQLGSKIILKITPNKILKLFPDSLYLRLVFRNILGERLNLDNPKTFNEKLQWLKLNDRKEKYTRLADKYEVREYISKTIGKQYLIPLIGVYDKFDEIDFNKLPQQFVLKCTHDSGGLVICKDKYKLDTKKAKKKINKSLKTNYYDLWREWPYKNITPRIICEKFISEEGRVPTDYKVLCFNGKAKLIQVHTDREIQHKQDFYDLSWNKLDITQGFSLSDTVVPKPEKIDKILELSEKLSKNMIHARIDWYIIEDKIYFGEITFFDGAGFTAFDNPEYDNLLGSWIDLSLGDKHGE